METIQWFITLTGHILNVVSKKMTRRSIEIPSKKIIGNEEKIRKRSKSQMKVWNG